MRELTVIPSPLIVLSLTLTLTSTRRAVAMKKPASYLASVSTVEICMHCFSFCANPVNLRRKRNEADQLWQKVLRTSGTPRRAAP